MKQVVNNWLIVYSCRSFGFALCRGKSRKRNGQGAYRR